MNIKELREKYPTTHEREAEMYTRNQPCQVCKRSMRYPSCMAGECWKLVRNMTRGRDQYKKEGE